MNSPSQLRAMLAGLRQLAANTVKLPSILQGRMAECVFVSRIRGLVGRMNLRSRIAGGENVCVAGSSFREVGSLLVSLGPEQSLSK
jgi:hypothetical protein